MFSRRLLSLFVAALMSTGMQCDPEEPTRMLTEITLSAASIVGGAPVQGTARISAAAPAAGFAVALSSSNTIAANVPASVTVPSGATSVPFTVTTTEVPNNTAIVITGVGGATRTANLTVAPPALTAVFSVTAGNIQNECRLQQGGATFDCQFDATASIGPIQSFEWTWTISPNQVTASTTQPTRVLNPVTTNGCGLFQGRTGGGAATPLNMVVRLVVRAQGGATHEFTNSNVVMIPRANTCGF